MTEAQYSVFGHIAVTERTIEASCLEEVRADVAILALGWEARSAAVDQYVALKARKFLLLEFALSRSEAVVLDANRIKLSKFAEICGTEIVTLRLGLSTDYQKNINIVDAALKQLATSDGSCGGSYKNIFIDCSSMPRIYIQWLIAYAFRAYSVNSLEFGYCEGVYVKKDGKQDFATGVSTYVTVPLLHGSGGMGEEKFLIVGIGGNTDLFYGLIDQFSPERIALLVPRSESYEEIGVLLNQQVAKVTETFRLEDSEVTNISGKRLAEAVQAAYFQGMRASISALGQPFATRSSVWVSQA